MKLPSEVLPDHPAYSVEEHYQYVKKLFLRYPYRDEDACVEKAVELTRSAPDYFAPFAESFVVDLLEDNRIFYRELSDFKFPVTLTNAQKRLSLNPERAFGATASFLNELISVLPKKGGSYTVPLGDLVSPDQYLALVFHTFYDLKDGDEYLFSDLHHTLWENMVRISGYDPRTYDGKQRLKYPKDDPANFRAYLANTPFLELLDARIPFTIPLKTYAEHGFLFAKSGHGKSQTMRSILADLFEEDCALFLLDGNGALIEGVDKIESIKDRLVILDPDESPALNFFSMHGASREKQMELFFYLFKAIDQGLTERQATMAAYLVDLMQSIPGATLDTLRHVCEGKLRPPLDGLEPIVQDFFTAHFYSKDALINQTKAQIAYQLLSVGRNRLFNAMFSAPTNNFNALECMQHKKIVVVNTTRDKLGDQGSAIFGRYILAQCLAAAWQRPKDQRHLALIMVDEAKTYLDEQSKKILSDARAFGVGMLLASQFPDQLEDGVRKEVINNTSVKLAGPAAYSVIAQLNRDMRCEPEFIMGMKKRDREYSEWACYVDNLTPHAIRLTVPFGVLEKLPTLSPAAHAQLRKDNKARMTATVNRTVNRVEPEATPPKKEEPRSINTSKLELDTDL